MQKIRLDLHIRFNPQNERHRRAAAYMEPVKEKYRTALVVAAMEEYQRQHPYGADYRELDEIRKAEKKAKEAAELKRLLKLMQKKDISVEDLEAMISREA